MADIVTTPIERAILRDGRDKPGKTVEKKAGFERAAERREQILDKAEDLLDWLEATTDEDKRKEIEKLGPLIRTFAKVDGWVKKHYPEHKNIAKLDILLDLYKKTWTLPEEIARYSAGLWWVLSRKVRDEASLSKKKKLAEAFLKDPYTYIGYNRDLFSTEDLEKAFVTNAGTLVLTEGLFEANPTEEHLYTTALEFTRDNRAYPPHSPEFQSYVDLRGRVLASKVAIHLNDSDRDKLLKYCPQMITTILESISVRPNMSINDALTALRLPNAETIELYNIINSANLRLEDFVGPYNSAYGLAYSFVRSQGQLEQFKNNNLYVNSILVYNKSWELHKELGLNLPQAQLQYEVQYLMGLYAQNRTDEEVNIIIQGEITRTGVNPVANILALAMNDYRILRWLISNPVGSLAIISNSLVSKKLLNPDASRSNRLKILLLLQGGDTSLVSAQGDAQLISDIQRSLNPPQTITNIDELRTAIDTLRTAYTLHMQGTKDKPGFEGKLKEFENTRSLTNLNIEVYSYFGLPPFANSGEISSAIKPFVTLRDAHAKVLDLNTGQIHPKFGELAVILQRLEQASPGLLESLVSGGFFYYKHKDKQGLSKDLSKYKGQNYRDLNSLKGAKDEQEIVLNPVTHFKNFVDLDYEPPEHGIKHYFDLIYGAAQDAGINQEVVDSLIVSKSMLLKTEVPGGGSIVPIAGPDELTLLAMYVTDGVNVRDRYRALNNAVNTAQALIDNPSYKSTYDTALVKAVIREEGISNVDIESKIIAMRKDKSPAAYLGVPEEVSTNTNLLHSFIVSTQLKLSRIQSITNTSHITDYIDNGLIARADLSPRILFSEASRIGNMFLQSPVDAQYFGDVVNLLSVSSNFRDKLFGLQLIEEIDNINSPLASEVLSRGGLLHAPNSVKRRYLRGISYAAVKLYNDVFSQNYGLFGTGGNLNIFDADNFLRFLYLMLGNPLDYVNGSETVHNRLRTFRDSFTDQQYNTTLFPGTPLTVSTRSVLQGASRLNDRGFNLYMSKLKELSAPNYGYNELRAAAIRDLRANKRLIEIYGKGADARTLAILSANISLGLKLRRLETSEERYEAAQGTNLIQ